MTKNKTLVGILVFSLIILLLHRVGIVGLISKDNLNAVIENINSYGSLAPLVFSLLYITTTLIGFSSAVLTVSAGLVFGAKLGYVLVIISATTSAMIAFVIARFLSGKIKVSSKKTVLTPLTKRIENNAHNNGFQTIVVLRLLFLPYIPLSYAAGLVKKLSFKDFFWGTLLTNLLGSFVFIVLGDSLTKKWYIFAVAILAVVGFNQIPKYIKTKDTVLK